MARVRRRLSQAARTPAAAGVDVIARMVLTSAVATAPSLIVAINDNPGVQPLAAVAPQPTITDGSLAAVPSAGSPVGVSHVVGPPPPAAVSAPGVVHIPPLALKAYQNADGVMARAMPGCGVSWNLLAGIGQIESRHAFGGKTDDRGTAVDPIFGPTLDGSLPGNEIIVAGRSNGRTVYARAMGPMQFLPSTWTLFASDGDGDGNADPQNLFDSTLAAANYLCSGGLNLRDRSQLISAVMRYNNSMAYTLNVLGWAEGYATGTPPVNLPPITGPKRSYGGTNSVTRAVDNRSAAPQIAVEETADEPATYRAPRRLSGTSNSRSDSSFTESSESRPTSSPGGVRSGTSRSATSSDAGSSSTPRVKIGNGRTGGARDTG
ncbi:lytic murein transglycosylase [Mycolicibacterium pulveris]|nr:lytic murein transglycosylase [Mycolicibacterium pulveris]MCV6979676.1 lytic murein transglycosylase [Mycolicibacterium pulveris]